jgi:competence protein ComEA
MVALAAAGLGARTSEAAQLGTPGRVEVSEKNAAKPEKPPAVKASRAEPAKADAKVNINAATKAQLMTLEGVGPTTAKRIIEHRAANGPFTKPDDLAKVDGVGKAVVERNAGRITVR